MKDRIERKTTSVVTTDYGVTVHVEGFTKDDIADLAVLLETRAKRFCRVLNGTAIPVVEDRNGRAK